MQKYFGSPQANRIATYIAEEFGDAPEFLWASTPDAAIFRNRSSKKWYGIIMSVAREKVDPYAKSSADDELITTRPHVTARFDATSDESSEVTVLNVKLETAEIADLLTQPGYYPAYHMNKSHWLSMILDETLPDERIMAHVEESYDLVEKGKKIQ